MRKRFLAATLLMTVLFTAFSGNVSSLQAAQLRTEETDKLLETAVEDMKNGNYASGEALVLVDSMQYGALVKEGAYRIDPDITIEKVNDFGEAQSDSKKSSYVVHLTSDKYSTQQLMEIALKQYNVRAVAPNQYHEIQEVNTSVYQWYLDGNNTSKGINFSKQKVSQQTTPVIAVIDTGVNYRHEDLKDIMWINPYQDRLPGVYGYDFGDNDDDPMDQYGHGSHVAGIAAATQKNGIGMDGVAKAQIMAVKATAGTDVTLADSAILASFQYVYSALELGVNIRAVNCSWNGSPDTNGILNEIINKIGEKGALTVFAAGNSSCNWDGVAKEKLVTPYDLDNPYVVIVGASNNKDCLARFSDYGATSVDLMAPGTSIISAGVKKYYFPDVLDSDSRKRTSLYYNQCMNDSENILISGQDFDDIYTAQQLGIPTSYSVDISYHLDGDNQYIKLDAILDNRPDYLSEIAGSMYVDVTDLNLDPNRSYYVSFLQAVEVGDDLYWENMNMLSKPGESSRFAFSNGRTYFRLVGISIQEGGYHQKVSYCFDNLSISIADLAEEDLVEYMSIEGTSMAAPVVSGAVATLSAANPAANAKTLRKILTGCVRKVDALGDKCITGGIIDLSKLYTQTTKVTLNKSTASIKYGKTLTLKAKVTPKYATNAKVKWTSSNTKYATVSSKGVVKVKKAGIGHTVKITATTTDGSKKKAICRISIKK
ncbi:MAG: S8 family serine peptidase [bacterium]|nr:S8 family serine peptidase [bacterium]